MNSKSFPVQGGRGGGRGLLPWALLTIHCSLLILLASCADIFQDKIPMPQTNASLSDIFNRSGAEITQLGTPTQFYVAPHYSTSEIRMTWNAVRGAAYYMIERAIAAPGEGEPDSGDYEPIERFEYRTFYVDKILTTPTLGSPEFQNEYFYRVSAFNTKQKYEESEPTEPLSAMLFRAPANVTASGGTSEEIVEVKWDRLPGAVLYEIWRSDFPDGASSSRIGEARGNQTTWFNNRVSAAEQGKDFYYKIIAKNSFGNETLPTRPAYGYVRVSGAPYAPANVRLAAGSGRGDSIEKIEIEWNAVDEAGAYYAVYRYSENDSSLTRLTENTDQTSWTDTQGLRPGIYYYYKVQAIKDDVSGKPLKSQFSSPDPEGFLLSSPDEVIAEKNSDDGTVTVKWKPAKGGGLERLGYAYNVYAGAATDGNFTIAEGSVSPATAADGYISSGRLSLSAGAFFTVSTVNGAVESAQSAVVSPSPAAAIIQDASQYAFIAGEAANSNGVYPVKITWKKPASADENPAFYNIQRSTKTISGFAKINEIELGANGPWSDVYTYDSVSGVYTYIDRNEVARVGRKYFYRVLSLNQLKQGSFLSDERIGWGALTHTQYMLEYNKTMNSALKKLTYMWKSGSTDKLGTETKYGSIGGTIYYNARLDGLGAYIEIKLTSYADYYIENEQSNGVYFTLSGNSDTSANMSSNGNMKGTVTCTGMYPGSVSYDRIEIKGGAAGGGTYGIQPAGFPRAEISYTVVN